jgi:hypothetical protein
MKRKSDKQPARTVEPEKLTKKYRRQTKHAPPEYRLVNRFRESHREAGANRPHDR